MSASDPGSGHQGKPLSRANDKPALHRCMEYRGGNYISQFAAVDECEAARQWAEYLRAVRPVPRSSSYLAKAVIANLGIGPPVSLNGVTGVWCVTAVCGGDLMIANIVESVPPWQRQLTTS